MILSDFGSIASIVALAIIVLGFIISNIKKRKEEYRKFEKMDALFKGYLVELVKKSTSSAKRADVSTFINFHLSNLRHKITQTYFSFLISLVIFCSLGITSILFEQRIFILFFILLILIESYFFRKTVIKLKRRLEETDNKISLAWVKHLRKSVKVDIENINKN